MQRPKKSLNCEFSTCLRLMIQDAKQRRRKREANKRRIQSSVDMEGEFEYVSFAIPDRSSRRLHNLFVGLDEMEELCGRQAEGVSADVCRLQQCRRAVTTMLESNAVGL